MKQLSAVILALAVGGVLATVFVSKCLNSRYASERAAQEAAWQQEKSELEAALEQAKAAARTPLAAPPAVVSAPAVVAATSPAEIMARLRALRTVPGSSATRVARQAIHGLEQLIAAGSAALPAIREFLQRNEDIDFEAALAAPFKGQRGAVPNEFVVPPSLRFGLFDVTRQIGGVQAEALLAEILASTGRGVELAWLTRALQTSAPNKYRDIALASARELLLRPLGQAGSPLDANDRDQLFSVLSLYGDSSYVATAQTQLVQADGAVDRSVLKYLQQTLGPQAVPLAAQTFDDPRITNPAHKEPLARLALNYVGADATANEFYQKAINDLALSNGHRKNLIEDLNQDGFADLKNLSARDLPLIENRIALIERLVPNATDPVNVAVFKEAYKDLVNMRQRIQGTPKPAR